MTTTDRAAYTVHAKAGAGGRTILAFEPVDSEVSALRQASLALDLKPGVTLKQAEMLAKELRTLVHGVVITRFDR